VQHYVLRVSRLQHCSQAKGVLNACCKSVRSISVAIFSVVHHAPSSCFYPCMDALTHPSLQDPHFVNGHCAPHLHPCCLTLLLLQALLLVGGGSWAAQLWGVSPASPLWGPAADFLSIRAAGAPVTVLLLVMQVSGGGVRGPGHTAAAVEA
jgi:hypothetical protein